ncbi:hypothetical protein L798_08385 [Zootermopsis nevadensis]|uniref:C2H2-type domain-containing protein n=1 Tax=Zootermopsis nevadensis TaxID=136037 RepID=A0A067RE19_ZOONE|nr:hypothetical protein L798_08385 [Zootermopsis nevadensis]
MLPPSPPSVKAYSLLEKHCPRVVRRKLFSPSKPRYVKQRLKKYTPTLHLETNHNQKKSNAESRKKKYLFKAVGKPTKICNKINRKTVVIPGNTDASIGTPLGGTVPYIRNKSVTRTESTQAAVLQTASEESELSAESMYSDQDIVKTSMILSSLLTPSQNPSAGTILTPTNISVCGSCVPMKIPTPPMYSAALSGPLMTSITSDEKNRSVANNIDKCLSPDTATSNSVILPEVACYSYKNTNTLKVMTKDRTYHRVPNNTFGNSLTETADLQKTSLKPRNCLWPTSYSQNLETSHSWTAGEFHQPKGNDTEMNALNSIQADGAKYVEKSPRRVCCRLSGRKRVQTYGITANKGSKQNTRTGYDMQKSLYFDCYTADPISHWHSKSGRGSRPCRSNIRNFTEECKGMKSKDPKLKIKMGDQKNDAKINKKRAYTRRNIGQDSSNNNKSLMTMCSNYTDQFSSKQSPKSLSTCEAQCIPRRIIQDKCENYFSSKNHHESRWSGQQISTSEESRKTLISASPYEQITNHTTCNYKSTSNGQYFPSENTSYLIIADGSNQCSSADNKSTENSAAVSSCSFINNKQQMEREYEYSPPMVTQYQQNFINTSDSIHNTYTPYHLQESTSQMQYNDQYFPSFKNNNRDTCTGMYEYADMLSDTFRFNRDQDQQNEYSQTSIIHDGYRNLTDETEANNYAHQLEENRQNNEYLQQSVDYNHISALCSTHNYCRMNQPAPTQSFVGYQLCSEIANVDDSQYYQLSSNITNLDEYYLPSSRALSTEDYQQTMFKRNENILNKQIINNQEHTNEEMFREKEEWQNPDFYSNHNNSVVQETYFNDKESIAYNSAGQTTSGYPYDSKQPPVQSNSFSRCDGKFLRPHSQFPDNFKLMGISEMSVNYRNMKLDVSDEKYAGTEKGNRKERKHRGRKKPDYEYKCPICGKNEQYKVLLNRHVELQHKHNK